MFQEYFSSLKISSKIEIIINPKLSVMAIFRDFHAHENTFKKANLFFIPIHLHKSEKLVFLLL